MDAISERLRARHPQKIDLSLERMRRLCAALGDPQNRLPPVIHVAGTNGKGSTVALIRAIAEARDAVEDVIEPYLLQQGLIQRTPRGRMLGQLGWRHLGLDMPRAAQAGLFDE